MKLNKILTAMLFLATLVGCGGVGTSSQPNSQLNSNEVGSSINSQGSTTEFSSATSEVNKVENKVKIKSIDVVDEEQKIKNARRMSSGNESSEETNNDIIISSEEIVSSSSENSETSSEETPSIDDINMNKNWVLIYKSQTDITFTVTLDDPRHLGIDALIITCDDPESQIKVGDTYKPIQMESDGTRMVDWGDDPYEQTYHIRTTSPDAVNSFKVLDVRITNHEKFQSEETDNRDLGNNELKIYKMDDDAIKLNVVENTFEYAKFNYVIKEGYEDLISNVVVEGMTPDEDGYYYMEEDGGFEENWSGISGYRLPKIINSKYDFYIDCSDSYVTKEMSDSVTKLYLRCTGYQNKTDVVYCYEYHGEVYYWLNFEVYGTNTEDHSIYYNGIKYVKTEYGGYFPGEDFGMRPGDGSDTDKNDYPSLTDKMHLFTVVIGTKKYKLLYETVGHRNYVYGLEELEDIRII